MNADGSERITRIGAYQIVSLLGKGGMGEVYRARDARLGRDVAIKVLPPDLAHRDDRRARLLREARAAAALNHPNICTVHEVGEADGRVYIAMEAIDGMPLSARVAEGPVESGELVRIAAALADALAHAHDRGIVHRDLKCANIMLTPDGRVKVLDFGLAAVIGGSELAEISTHLAAPLTEPGTLVGTVAYMAPEVLRGESADVRSDIWALGVVLHELASGARPFAGATPFELSSSILHDGPPPLPARVGEGLHSVIHRCLEKSPARRYQRASEVRAALEVLAPRSAVPAQVSVRRSYRTATIGLSIAAAIALAAGIVWWNPALRSRWFGPSDTIRSVAVLPLENLSADKEQDYFVAGMHEALITDLARAGFERVIAKPSSDGYKGSNKPLSQIGRELGADGLITGAVMRAGDRLQITAQLVRPDTGAVVWANRYEGSAADALSVQNEIVAAIAREVRATTSSARLARLTPPRPVNPDAYDAYLRARFLFSNFSNAPDPRQLQAAYAQFERAIKSDPSYAPAHASFSMALQAAPQIGLQSPQTTLARARTLARRAVELDDGLPEAHAALGAVLFWNDWDWPAAEREIARALELNPNSVDALGIAETHATLITRRTDAALESSRRILSLDPLNPFSRIQVGWVAMFSRRYDDAVGAFRALLELYPEHLFGHSILSTVYGAQRRRSEVRAECAKVMQLLGANYYTQAIGECVWALGFAGESDEAKRLLARLEQPPPGVWTDPAVMANAYTGVSDFDRAMTWIERGIDERAPNMIYMNVGVQWDSLRGDSRFQAQLARLNFPR